MAMQPYRMIPIKQISPELFGKKVAIMPEIKKDKLPIWAPIGKAVVLIVMLVVGNLCARWALGF